MENRAYERAEERSITDLRERINELVERGLASQKGIERDLTTAEGKPLVSRPLINQFCNGRNTLDEAKRQHLWAWLDAFEEKQRLSIPSALPQKEYRQEVTYFPTRQHSMAMGKIKMLMEADDMWLGAVIGAPGTGKTTLARKLQERFPKVIYLEAFPSMRMSDVLRKLGKALGITLSGTINQREEDVMAALNGGGYTIVVDETEYLKRWDTLKLDTLRKMCEDSGTTLLLFGTEAAKGIIKRMDQVSSRAKLFDIGPVEMEEVREELRHYDMEPEAAELMVSAVESTKRGGLRKYHNVLNFCLRLADGGQITESIMRDALDFCNF